MYKKRFCALFLCFIIILANVPVKAFSTNYKSEDFIITTVEENEGYTIIKFENKHNGEIEYLTISTNLQKGKEAVITDENNEIKSVILESDYRTPEKIEHNNFGITPYAYGPWSNSNWNYSSKQVEYRNYARLVAAIVIICGASGAGSAIYAIADFCVDNYVNQVYYKFKIQYRSDPVILKYQGKRTTMCYSDSGRTNYIGTNVDIWTGDATN